jgi:hypothetical protein
MVSTYLDTYTKTSLASSGIIIIIASTSSLYKIQYTGNPLLNINASVLLYFLWLGNLNSTILLKSTTILTHVSHAIHVTKNYVTYA